MRISDWSSDVCSSDLPVSEAVFLHRPLCLAQIGGIDVDAGDHGAALRQLEAVEAGVASDVERRPAAQILGQVARDLLPLEGRKITEGMVGRRLRAVRQVQIMEPWSKRGDLVVATQIGRAHV